jgi:hypothetical protein
MGGGFESPLCPRTTTQFNLIEPTAGFPVSEMPASIFKAAAGLRVSSIFAMDLSKVD